MAATALVVLVPELEPLVGTWRLSLTGDGARGMPPHVTLLYPFADDEDVEPLLPDVARIFAGSAPFEVTLAEVRRWPDVVYVAPEPAERFVALVERLVEAFPEYPPYGGAHDEIVPHITVAHGGEDRFDEIDAALTPSLPLRVRVERAWLMVEAGGRWRRETPFPFDRR
jgi:2'-5' RNA ligase